MRIFIIYAAILCSGCMSMSPHQHQTHLDARTISIPDHLTVVQWFYIWKYERYRERGIKQFSLLESATLEDFRPYIAMMLGLPHTASIHEILAHPKVAALLTEERRSMVVDVFGLPPNATWEDIQIIAERIRLSRKQQKLP